MKTIQVQTDDSIIQKLKNAFTSPSTVLSEAMQNARRAGASFVKVRYLDEDAISIEDDGQGIADLGDFLTLAGSGWDKDVIEREGAFGMGSFSMLYYCERIIVESNGLGFEANTADILQHKPVTLFESKVTEGTKIQLFGYEISDENNASRIEQELRRLALAFPISVFYDDEELEQPHRLDASGINFISTAVGEIFVAEYELDVEKLRTSAMQLKYGSKDTQLYYQGLPIGHTSKYMSKNIVHVNEQAFEVRMPDRDVLISHDDALGFIDAEITHLWHEKINQIRNQMGDEEFVNSMAATVRRWDYKCIFNDIDYLPSDITFVIESAPVVGTFDGREGYIRECSGLTRSQLENQNVTILKLPRRYSSDDPKVEQYAYHLGVICVDSHSLSKLDDSHWLMNLVKTVDEDEILVKSHGTGESLEFEGSTWLLYTPCEKIEISGPIGSFDIEDMCFGIDEENLLVPQKATSGQDLLLIADYSEEYGGYDDNAAEVDTDRFESLLTVLNSSREEGLLNMIRRANLTSAGMNGKQLIVTFDAEGNPCEVQERDSAEAA